MNPSTGLAAVIIDELIRCGLREVVVAPGSRSAPLAMEFFRRAELGDLRLSVRIDERSASFLALGLAKASRVPVAIVCTSGTAAAHFHAAVIEADESGVPLLVLTADRPPELRGTGANQTIDQLKLYGSAVRWFCEVGVPEDGVPATGYWRSMAARAWGLASGAAGGPPGPVHLNLPLRDPLVPAVLARGDNPLRTSDGADAEIDAGLGGRADGGPWTRFGAVARIDWTERGLIVCGDGDYDPEPLRLAGAGRAVVECPGGGAGAVGVSVPDRRLAIPGRTPAGRDRLGRSPWTVPGTVGSAARAGDKARRARGRTGPMVGSGSDGDRYGDCG